MRKRSLTADDKGAIAFAVKRPEDSLVMLFKDIDRALSDYHTMKIFEDERRKDTPTVQKKKYAELEGDTEKLIHWLLGSEIYDLEHVFNVIDDGLGRGEFVELTERLLKDLGTLWRLANMANERAMRDRTRRPKKSEAAPDRTLAVAVRLAYEEQLGARATTTAAGPFERCLAVVLARAGCPCGDCHALTLVARKTNTAAYAEARHWFEDRRRKRETWAARVRELLR